MLDYEKNIIPKTVKDIKKKQIDSEQLMAQNQFFSDEDLPQEEFTDFLYHLDS